MILLVVKAMKYLTASYRALFIFCSSRAYIVAVSLKPYPA